MYVIIFLATLVTLLVIILSTAVHLISILIEESDDGTSQVYGIDGQVFSTTPVVSPNDNLVHHHQDEPQQPFSSGRTSSLRQLNAPTATVAQQQVEGAAIEVPSMSLMSPMLLAGADTTLPVEPVMSPQDIISASPEEIQSAEMNSRLLKQCESQREDALAQQQPTPGPGAPTISLDSTSASEEQVPSEDAAAVSLEAWAHKPPDVQKSMILSQLGQPACKQIFDDCDPREMQLGGTALHWCKTRKSLDKLIKLGLPTDIVNKRRETPVHVAVRRHKLQVLIGLLINDAPVDGRNEHGETPLIVACKLNDLYAAQLLMVFDADYDAQDERGHSARHYTSAICARHMSQQQLPSAAHLILAMLNEIGAKRCPGVSRPTSATGKGAALVTGQQEANDARSASAQSTNNTNTDGPTRKPVQACTDGCAHTGAYNGNSYNRWPNFKRESLYKRHMFSDLIDSKLRREEEKKCEQNNDVDRPSSSSSAASRWWNCRPPPAPAKPKPPNRETAKSRLLCIDGGGMRGVIVCQIMIEMEKYLKRPMFSYFDWVGGTSVGAFLACALCRGATIKEMRRVCFDVKDEVFSGGRPYNSKFLERVLKRQYGSSTRMSEVRGVKLAVTTVLADREPCQLRLFRNYDSPGRLLEMHGYAQDTFNTMSGHSIMSGAQSGRHQVATNGGRLTKKPLSSSSSSSSSSSASSSSRTTKTTTTTVDALDRCDCDNICSQISIRAERAMNDVDEGGGPGNSSGAPQLDRGESDSLTTTPALATGANQITNKDIPPGGEQMLDENDPDPIMWQAVRASAAAPFFFKPYGPYLDGGIISNNPTLDMLSEFESYQKVRRFLRTRKTEAAELNSQLLPPPPPSRLDLVVSLGTGRGRVISRQTMVDFGQVTSGFATVFSPVELVRSIRAARDLFKKLMQQSCHTEDHILDRAQAWCSSLEVPYFRINPPLATIFSIDDKRDEQLINALWQTKLYMRSISDQLVQLGKLLDDEHVA